MKCLSLPDFFELWSKLFCFTLALSCFLLGCLALMFSIHSGFSSKQSRHGLVPALPSAMTMALGVLLLGFTVAFNFAVADWIKANTFLGSQCPGSKLPRPKPPSPCKIRRYIKIVFIVLTFVCMATEIFSTAVLWFSGQYLRASYFVVGDYPNRCFCKKFSSFDALREFEVLVNQTKADSCYQLHFDDPASRCLANYDERKMNGTTTQHFMEECQLPALMEQTIVSVKSDECTFFRNYERWAQLFMVALPILVLMKMYVAVVTLLYWPEVKPDTKTAEEERSSSIRHLLSVYDEVPTEAFAMTALPANDSPTSHEHQPMMTSTQLMGQLTHATIHRRPRSLAMPPGQLSILSAIEESYPPRPPKVPSEVGDERYVHSTPKVSLPSEPLFHPPETVPVRLGDLNQNTLRKTSSGTVLLSTFNSRKNLNKALVGVPVYGEEAQVMSPTMHF